MRKYCTPPAKLITTLFQLLSNSRSYDFLLPRYRLFASLNGAGFTLFRAPSRRSSVAPLLQIGKRVENQRVIIDTFPLVHATSPNLFFFFFSLLTPVRVPVSRDRARSRVLLSTPVLQVLRTTFGGYHGDYFYLDLFHQGVIPREDFPVYLKDSPVR